MTGNSPRHQYPDRPTATPGLPRSVLRRLVSDGRITIGSRVLDVGCGQGELLRFLDELCVDAVGLDESLENIRSAQAAAPGVTCRCGTPRERLPFPDHHFNVVLARDLSVYAGDLLCSESLCSTARLLAAIRPGGVLCVVLSHSQPPRQFVPAATEQDVPRVQHDSLCLERHLATFMTDVHISRIDLGWNWLRWSASGTTYLIGTLQVPVDSRSLNDWLRLALRAAAHRSGACCQPASAAQRALSRSRRVA